MRNPTRRKIIATMAALPVIGHCGGHADNNMPLDPQESDLTRLWFKRAELIAQRDALDQRWLEVRRRLPSWTMPGPKYLDADERPEGPRVGWPAAIPTEMVKLNDGRVLVRPSPADLRAIYNAETQSMSASQAKANYRVRSRQLLIRLRAMRACTASYGLPVTADWVPIDASIDAIELAIEHIGGNIISPPNSRTLTS
jgi:hypothetical protein